MLKSVYGITAEGDGRGGSCVLKVCSEVFMELPAGAKRSAVHLDCICDCIENFGVLMPGPFRMQPDWGAFFEPLSICLKEIGVFFDGVDSIDNDFELIRFLKIFGEGPAPAFGAQRDPVKIAANWKSAACFKVNLKPDRSECIRQELQLVDRWLASSDDDKLG